MSTSIGEVSLDWAQLSLHLEDGGSIDRPEGDGTEDFSHILGTNLEGDPSVRHGQPRALTCSRVQPKWLQVYFSSALQALDSGRDWHLWFGIFLWHLALRPPHPLTLTHPHLSKMAEREKTEQGPENQGLEGQHMIRIRDQAEMQVSPLSMTSR